MASDGSEPGRPQVGDVWADYDAPQDEVPPVTVVQITGDLVRVYNEDQPNEGHWCLNVSNFEGCTLIRRAGRPWPPRQEQEGE